MKKIIIIFLIAGFNLSAIEINLNKVIFKNSNNEYYISNDNGKHFKKSRFVENMFQNQRFISTDEKVFLSDDKGTHWQEKEELHSRIETTDRVVLKIFPNPTNQLFTISSVSKITEIEVFNIFGSFMVKLTELDSNEELINIESFKSGTYIVRIKTEDGVKYSKVLVSR